MPLFFARGEGARLYDVDGNVHIDYVLGNGPAILGHAPKPVIEAVARRSAEGQVYAAQHPRETELAERLCRLLPGAEVVRFATSGTEAVLMAMRLARAFTGRDKILKFEGHYHGWSDQAYISARPSLNEAGPADEPVPVAGSPGIPASVLQDVVVAGWNDLAALEAAFDRHDGEIAAVIMEPVMVNGGAVVPEPGYLAGVRDLCRAKGALFICDEVITGFRVGLRGAQGRFGVTADLAIYAKAVAAGFPLAMVAGRRDVMDTLSRQGRDAWRHLQRQRPEHGGGHRGPRRAGARRRRGLSRPRAARHAADAGACRTGAASTACRCACRACRRSSRSSSPPAPAPRNYREADACDRDGVLAFHRALQEEGIRINQAGKWFLSTAHDDAIIDQTLAAADRAMAALR